MLTDSLDDQRRLLETVRDQGPEHPDAAGAPGRELVGLYVAAAGALREGSFDQAQKAVNELRFRLSDGLKRRDVPSATAVTLLADAFLEQDPGLAALRHAVDQGIGQAQLAWDREGATTDADIRLPLHNTMPRALGLHPDFERIADLAVPEGQPDCLKPMAMDEFAERYNPARAIQLQRGSRPFLPKPSLTLQDTVEQALAASRAERPFEQTRAFLRYITPTHEQESNFLKALGDLIQPQEGYWVESTGKERREKLGKTMAVALDSGEFSHEFLAKAYDAVRTDLGRTPEAGVLSVALNAMDKIIARRLLAPGGSEAFREQMVDGFAAIDVAPPPLFQMNPDQLRSYKGGQHY